MSAVRNVPDPPAPLKADNSVIAEHPLTRGNPHLLMPLAALAAQNKGRGLDFDATLLVFALDEFVRSQHQGQPLSAADGVGGVAGGKLVLIELKLDASTATSLSTKQLLKQRESFRDILLSAAPNCPVCPVMLVIVPTGSSQLRRRLNRMRNESHDFATLCLCCTPSQLPGYWGC